MEGNENTGTTATSGTNGIFSNPHHHQHQQQQQQHHHHHHQQNPSHYSSSEPTPLVFPPHSVTGRAPLTSSPPTETVRRKRGRPRKYGTSEAPQTASANKKLPSSTSSPSPSTSLPLPSSPRKKEPSSVSSPSSSYSKKSQLAALGEFP
ncbi:hypothetical protein BVC80_9099g284 [Macleaya cordata]|uniref:AT-hook motif nuclear-localized protein n=1 Tax=Macleaya cordata TaxID=56857 RepID=A0A200PW64_MACCD|nr:hypothetical protein BVC80_9099g284 [Macleaya cordata]